MRFFPFSRGHIKLAGLICLVLVTSAFLSSCAGMMNQLGYVPIEKQQAKACSAAPVLITNLTLNPHHRKYQLPNGKICPGVNYYEQDKLQSENMDMGDYIL
ncbi:MAG: hypothetical protein Q8L78_05365 [Coxiellaceae bacterium]|nr:hypothetical protein [Coxiellaceae bacterium]